VGRSCASLNWASAVVCLLARSSRAGATAHPPLPCLLPCHEPHHHCVDEYSRYLARIFTTPTITTDILVPSRLCALPDRPRHLSCRADARALNRPDAPTATGLMTTIFARSPLQSLPMAANRPTTRRRSVKQAFEDDDAPAPTSKRPRTEANGTSKRTNGATKKAAKAAYEEDDDGFQFSRRTSKRTTKAQAAPAPEPIPEEPPAKSARAQDPLPAKPTARRKKTSITVVDMEVSDTKRRRSTRLSGDKEQLEVRPKAAEAPAARRTKKSAPVEKERKKQITPAPEAQPEQRTAFMGTKTPTQNELTVAKRRDPNAQRIMLPFADTPVITRNKEMRKGSKDGHRRSSTGLRGRRASSLIDSGMSNGELRQTRATGRALQRQFS
jgi:hypothetical protein